MNMVYLKCFTGTELYDLPIFPWLEMFYLIFIEEQVSAFEKTSGELVLQLVDDVFELFTI